MSFSGFMRRYGLAGLAVTAALAGSPASADEPTTQPAQPAQAIHYGTDTELTYFDRKVSPRIEIYEQGSYGRRDLAIIEGEDGVSVHRAGVALPLSFALPGGRYAGELDIFGEQDTQYSPLRSYGFGFNMDGWFDETIRVSLIGEYAHRDERKRVSYRDERLRWADDKLARHQRRLQNVWGRLEPFPALRERLSYFDPAEVGAARDQLEQLARYLGQERNVEIVARDRTFLGGIRIGTRFTHGNAASEPNIGIYSVDGTVLVSPAYFVVFGPEQQNIFGTGLILGDDEYRVMNVAVGGFSKEPGKGWNWRITGSTDFQKRYKIGSRVTWGPYGDLFFIRGPIDFVDDGDTDMGIVTNPMDYQVPPYHEFGRFLTADAEYTHMHDSRESPWNDSVKVQAHVYPFAVLSELSGEPLEDPLGLLEGFHIGGGIEYEWGSHADTTSFLRAGTSIRLGERGGLDIYAEKREGDDVGAFLRLSVPIK